MTVQPWRRPVHATISSRTLSLGSLPFHAPSSRQAALAIQNGVRPKSRQAQTSTVDNSENSESSEGAALVNKISTEAIETCLLSGQPNERSSLVFRWARAERQPCSSYGVVSPCEHW